jgi:hypothetical protein
MGPHRSSSASVNAGSDGDKGFVVADPAAKLNAPLFLERVGSTLGGILRGTRGPRVHCFSSESVSVGADGDAGFVAANSHAGLGSFPGVNQDNIG